MPPVDPNNVMMTGENSFIRLSVNGGLTVRTRLSHWRVLWSPAGSGHSLFMLSELTGDDPRVYTDNEAVTRWLQESIETYLFPLFADVSLPVTSATFSRYGDPYTALHERIDADGETVVMTWSDCIEPFVLHMPPAVPPERPIGVFSTFIPARTAEVELNGRKAAGTPIPEMRGDRQSSTAALAWSETWVMPPA